GRDVPKGGIGAAGNAGPIARYRARYLLVGGPLGCPRRVQPPVELVGRRQRLVQRLRPGGAAEAARQQTADRTHPRGCAQPPPVRNSHVLPPTSAARYAFPHARSAPRSPRAELRSVAGG